MFWKVASSGGGGGGARSPKVLICRQSGQNPWKSGQKWRPMLFEFKKWRPMFAEKQMKAFLEVRGHTKMVFSSWFLWEKICRQKSHNNFLGKFEEILAKSFEPQKICTYTYGCKCARMRFHCANGLVVLRSFARERQAGPASNIKVGYFSGSQFHNGFATVRRDEVYLTTMLWQNNGRQNDLYREQ